MDVIKALSLIYIVLSILDAVITAAIIKCFSDEGFIHETEANPIVAYIIKNFGIFGMLIFKAIMVVMSISIARLVHKNNHRRHSVFRRFIPPHYIIWLGIWTTLFAIVCGIAYYILYYGV